LLKKKLKRYPHINELEYFLKNIQKKDLKLVLLFGSIAKGNYTQYSDIDVLCVYNKKFKDLKERFIYSYKNSLGMVQPKTITFEEFKNVLINGNSFIHSIIKTGYILYSKIPKRDIDKWYIEGKKKLNIKYFGVS